MARPIKLFYAPSMAALAHSISEQSRRIPGQEIKLGELEMPVWRNGWCHPIIKDINRFPDLDVAFLMSLDEEVDVSRQFSAARWMAMKKPHTFQILMPWFPNGTMDRSDREDDVCTAETLASNFLMIPPVRGTVPVWVLDIHSLQEQNYFPANNVSVRLSTSMNMLQEEFTPEMGAIVLPDDGAEKRYKAHFYNREADRYLYDFIVCGKHRDGDKRHVRVTEGDPRKFERAVIIDDLTRTAGTLIKCKEALQAINPNIKVSAHVAHGDFESREVVERIKAAGFERFYMTNSCPVKAGWVKDDPAFKILSIDKLAVAAIRRGLD